MAEDPVLETDALSDTHSLAGKPRAFLVNLPHGSEGWGRTSNHPVQSRGPYHLATSEYLVNMAPVAGFEPATFSLTGSYSTTELHRNIWEPSSKCSYAVAIRTNKVAFCYL